MYLDARLYKLKELIFFIQWNSEWELNGKKVKSCKPGPLHRLLFLYDGLRKNMVRYYLSKEQQN